MNDREQINYYENELNIEDIVKSLDLKHIDEAVYLCDLKRIKEKYDLWRKYMPNIQPFYAVKCNNDHLVLKTLASLGCGFDCASKTEIQQILNLNVQSDRILFAQPCKMITHLAYAKAQHVNILTVDNEIEIHKIKKYYPNASLVIRFRCDAKAAIPLGKKFGCEPYKEAPALISLAKKLNLNVIGFSFHVGSSCIEYEAYDRAITISKHLYQFARLIGHNIKLIDIGGGFIGNNDELFKKIANTIRTSLAYNFPDYVKNKNCDSNNDCENDNDRNDGIQIIAEPGNYFVSSAFTLICKIIAKRIVKCDPDNELKLMYYLNDGCYGSFKAVLQHPEHRFITVKYFMNDKKLRKTYKTTLWGPTCDSSDMIIENINLPNLNCNDILYFPNMGGYTLVTTTTFNGFPPPVILYFSCQK